MEAEVGPDWPRLDEANHCIVRGQHSIRLRPKAFEVLRFLVSHADRMVSKSELLDVAWPHTHVTEAVLTVAIRQLREALADDARQPRFIETLHRRGYRWIGRFAPPVGRQGDASADVLADLAAPAIVGRVNALTSLEQALARASAGQRQLVFVTGEAGVGKTTLVDAFVASVTSQRRDALVASGQCVDSYGASEPYMPLLEALERLIQTPGRDDLIATLKRYAPTWLVQLPGVIAASEVEALRLSLAASTGARMVRELLRAGEAMSATELIVVVLEDLHWADTATIDFLAAFANRREPARILILATLRLDDALAERHPVATLLRDLEARRRCSTVALTGLDGGEVAGYLSARFPDSGFPPALAEVLQEQTGGNPLFLSNAVDDLVLRGWLQEIDGSWQCTVPLGEVRDAVPDGTLVMIEERLDRLAEGDRKLLEAASIIGSVFATQTLAALVGGDSGEVEERCAWLARTRQYLERGAAVQWPDGSRGREYSFRHALYPQVLRDRVADTRRKEMHLRIAQSIEAGYGAAAMEIAALLAHHYEQGGAADHAVRFLRLAARQALGRFANAETALHLRRGIALLDGLEETPERRSEKIALLGWLMTTLYADAGPNLVEVEALASRIKDLTGPELNSVEVLQALGAVTACHAGMGEIREAALLATDLIDRAQRLEPSGEILARAACLAKGTYDYLQGDLAGGLATLERTVGLPPLVPTTVVEPAAAGPAEAAVCQALLGRPRLGMEILRDAFARAADARHPPTLAYVASVALRFGILLGIRNLVQGMAQVLAEITERHQVARWQGLAHIGFGWVKYEVGDPLAATEIHAGRVQLGSIGYHLHSGYFRAIEAAALLRCGKGAEAWETVEAGLAHVAQSGEHWCEAELLRLRAEMLWSGVDAELHGRSRRSRAAAAAAQELWRGAVDLACGQGNLLSAQSAASSWEAHVGRQGEAAERVAAVRTALPEDPDLQDVRAAGDFLAGAPG